MTTQQKYSLWIVPKAESGRKLQEFLHVLAQENNAPLFVPHVTLVANILAAPDELPPIIEHINRLAQSIAPFTITMSDFDYLDEEFRCLYLKTTPSEKLETLYTKTAGAFPQVTEEHFQGMPHMSVMYGHYTPDIKESLIAKYKNSDYMDLTFTVDSIDLYHTDSPIESWTLNRSFKLNDTSVPRN